MRVSKEEQRQIADLLKGWEARIRAQASAFESVTKVALEADSEITANTTKVRNMRKEQTEARAKLEVASGTVNQIWEHQEALGNLLTGLQESLELTEQPSKADNRTRGLESQLDELCRQVQELAVETANFHTSNYVRPLDRVAHVLDAHSSELDSVQERLDAAERQLRNVVGKV